MYNASSGFKTAVKQHSRVLGAKVVINSNTYYDDNIVEMVYEDTSNSSETFSVGDVSSAVLELTVTGVNEAFETATVTPYIGVSVSGTLEYVPLGVFYVDNVDRKKDVTKLTCYDGMIKLEKGYFSSLTYPATIAAVINEICAQTGVQFSGTLPNYSITTKPEGYTLREMVALIASMCGGFAKFDRTGKLTIKSYTTITESVTADQYIEYAKKKDSVYRIDKVTCQVGDSTLSKGTLSAGGSEVTFENPFVTDAILTDIYNKLNGFQYMPLYVKSNGNPALECGDIITFTTIDNQTYSIPIMSHRLTYSGGLIGEIESVGETQNSNQFSSSGSLAQKVDRVVYEQAIINDAMVNSLNATNARIDNLRVTTAMIDDLAVTTAKIADAAITNTKVANASIDNAKIANAAIGTAKIQTGAITNALIANAAIQTANIADASVTNAKIQDGAITNAKIANATIGTAQIADASITTAKIQDAAITNTKIANLAVDNAKIANVDAGKITTGTLDANRIAAGSITTDKLVVGDFTNLCTNPVFEDGTTKDWTGISVLISSDPSVPTDAPTVYVGKQSARDGYGSDYFPVSPGDKFYCEVTAATLNSTNQFKAGLAFYDKNKKEFIWLGTNYLSPSSTWTTATGTVIVPSNAVYARVWTQINAFSNFGDWFFTNVKVRRIVGTALIDDLSVTTAKIADASITNAKIANLAVDNAKIADASITSAKIQDGSITNADIANATITGAKIASATITGANIASATIDTANIKAGAITTALIGTGAVQTAQIADGSITDAKIVSLTANKITAGTIDTGQVTVQGTNGKLKIAGNRLQVFDNQPKPVERVALGDVNGDGTAYGLKVRSADGTTVLYDHNGVYSAGITDGAITNSKISSGAVDNRVIAANAITADKIVAGTITGDKIASNTITANNIAANTITAGSAIIADGAITSAKIATAAIGTAHIADGSITNAKIANAAIDNAKIANIDAGKITTGTLNADRIGASSITVDKLVVADLTNFCVNPVFDGGSNQEWYGVVAVHNSAAGVPTGAPTTYVGKQSSRDGYCGKFFPVREGDKFYIEAWVATPDSTYQFGVGLNFQKEDGTNTWVRGFQTAPVGSWTKISGEVTVPSGFTKARVWTQIDATSNFGNWYMTKITVLRKANTELIVDGAITASKIAAGAITAGSAIIADGAITSAKIADAAIGTAAIQDGAITNAKIAKLAVGTAQIQDGAITNAKIANLAVDDAKIASLHGSKITANSITADKLNVTDLSAISANLGTVTAGTLKAVTLDSVTGTFSGSIKATTLVVDSQNTEPHQIKLRMNFMNGTTYAVIKGYNDGIYARGTLFINREVDGVPSSLGCVNLNVTALELNSGNLQTKGTVSCAYVISSGTVDAFEGINVYGSSYIYTPDRGWIAPTLLNGWVNYGSGYETASYYKDALGFIRLKGLIKGGTMGAAAFVLPAEFRPSARKIFTVLTAGGVGRVDIDTSGNVLIMNYGTASNGWVSLDGITFNR
ncbi:pentapeptide repeat-containing protein [Geobacillus sp. FJAT-46040]|uniref:beta strand repeat-containing protein n=1 Tax=Geobacillus sp. FJAT-46040 TaxID=2011017 RepID=UPI000BB6E6C4|nr:pentapeptide repeat-containing protein [Geobacillus sp. FJAT-46040]